MYSNGFTIAQYTICHSHNHMCHPVGILDSGFGFYQTRSLLNLLKSFFQWYFNLSNHPSAISLMTICVDNSPCCGGSVVANGYLDNDIRRTLMGSWDCTRHKLFTSMRPKAAPAWGHIAYGPFIHMQISLVGISDYLNTLFLTYQSEYSFCLFLFLSLLATLMKWLRSFGLPKAEEGKHGAEYWTILLLYMHMFEFISVCILWTQN